MFDYQKILCDFAVDDRYFRRYVKMVSWAHTIDWGDEDVEFHHILPKSIFPLYKDYPKNIVKVSKRVHYLLHYLLYKLSLQDSMLMALQITAARCGYTKSVLYQSIALSFQKLQESRRHWYNVHTGEHVFAVHKPTDDFINAAPECGKGKPIGYKQWVYNPSTNEQRVILNGDDIPDGFVRGRVKSSSFDGWHAVNQLIKVYDFKEKRCVLTDTVYHWQEPDIGRAISETDNVYISKDGHISLIPTRLFPWLKFGGKGKYRREITDIIKPPHWNMSESVKEFSQKFHGMRYIDALECKTLTIKDFIYHDGYRTINT
jgi:hypothetical protein|nr:MAG TPA: HNH endonuclease [Caudoviricetes sp.]